MKPASILLIILLLAACSPASPSDRGEATPSPASSIDFSGVHLRLRNLSGLDFENVELTVGSQSEQIGPLPQAATSDYVTFTAVPPTLTLHATRSETTYDWTAAPTAGEGLIAGGEFTLELTIENDSLFVSFLMENPILQDAQYYADDRGITLEEALSRLDNQNDAAISALQNQLQANEAGTFAGLWLQHEPAYHVVVAFTQNGEETIRKYVAEDSELAQLIEVRSALYTYAQLKADQQAVLHIMETIQQPFAVGILVMENQVGLDVTDRAAFEAALAEANLTLPESVVVNTVYESIGENPPFAVTSVPDVFMPQLKQRDVAFMEALLMGELIVQDGCLRVRTNDESRLVIWQADYFLTNNDGILEILDETGAIAARVGDRVYLGGGEQRIVDENELHQPIPNECAGPYWRMGDFLPEEYIPNVSTDLPPLTQSYDGWETGYAFDFPTRWRVNEMRFDAEWVTAVLASRPLPTENFEPLLSRDEMATFMFMPLDEPVDESALSAEGLLAAMVQFAAHLPPNQETIVSPHTISLDNRPAAAMVYASEHVDTTTETYFVMTADSGHLIWAMGITPIGENWQIRPKIQALLNSLQPISVNAWQSHVISDFNLSFAYPANWYVHEAGKALQITPNSQPVWSSFADPGQPNNGPYFDFLHNLNRQMAATPLAEVEFLLHGYEGKVEAIEPVAPLAYRPDIVMGVYHFTNDEEGMALLIGAAVSPVEDNIQPVIAMTSVVKLETLTDIQPFFITVLRSIRPANSPMLPSASP